MSSECLSNSFIVAVHRKPKFRNFRESRKDTIAADRIFFCFIDSVWFHVSVSTANVQLGANILSIYGNFIAVEADKKQISKPQNKRNKQSLFVGVFDNLLTDSERSWQVVNANADCI